MSSMELERYSESHVQKLWVIDCTKEKKGGSRPFRVKIKHVEIGGEEKYVMSTYLR